MKATQLDVPKNVYLSWGAATGDLAIDGDFVEQWRLAIASDFLREPIEIVAYHVLTRCKGGKNYSGLDKRKGVCKGGTWVKKGHLAPSEAIAKREKDLVQNCIFFAKKALGKSNLGYNLSFSRISRSKVRN